MSGAPDLAFVRLEVRPVPGLKCIVIAPVGMMHALAHVTTATDTPQPLTERELAIANRLVLAWNIHGKLRTTLRELVDWCREHTSPRDASSPHQLLVNATAVLDAAAGDSQQPDEPDQAAVLRTRYSQILARAQALRDCSWLDFDPAASAELAQAKQNMLDFLTEVDRESAASAAVRA